MLDREDYRRYIEQMEAIEKSMINVYSVCASLSGEGALRDDFLSLTEDEKRHFRLLGLLREIFI